TVVRIRARGLVALIARIVEERIEAGGLPRWAAGGVASLVAGLVVDRSCRSWCEEIAQRDRVDVVERNGLRGSVVHQRVRVVADVGELQDPVPVHLLRDRQ